MRVAAIILGLFIGASALLVVLFTAAVPADVGTARDLPFAASDVAFRTADSLTIRGWYAPGHADSGVVILLHGYHGNRTHMIPRATMLQQAGYGVLLYDARGCGASEGSLVSMGYYETEDLLAAVRFLQRQGERRIACIGVSQGGATIALAAGRLADVGAVVCESTYDDLDRALDRRFRHYVVVPAALGAVLVRPIGQWRLGCSIAGIAPADSIARLAAPLLVVSGDHDARVWNADTRRLFDSARAPKDLWFVAGAGHEDLYEAAPDEYRRRILEFLARSLAGR